MLARSRLEVTTEALSSLAYDCPFRFDFSRKHDSVSPYFPLVDTRGSRVRLKRDSFVLPGGLSMNRRSTSVSLAVCLTLFLSLVPLGAAQTSTETASALPRLVRFGGVVKDLNDNPLTGVVGITFALYSEQTGGAALWLETQNVTADSNGHYVALLGSTKPDGLPAELHFRAGALGGRASFRTGRATARAAGKRSLCV